jgi:hypothetical protein
MNYITSYLKGLIKHTLWLLFLGATIPVLADQPNKGADQTYKETATGTIRVAFSPNGGATKLVTDTLGRAKKQILVQAYSFTSPAISKLQGPGGRQG